jgi:hypothetical protein
VSDPAAEEQHLLTRGGVAALTIAVGVLSVLVLASCAVVAIAHIEDDNGAIGPWTALAQYVNSGTFYPPLYHDGYYGGTRYMPLQMALYAVGGRISGEYLVSGKVIAFLIAVALVALVFRILTRLGCPRVLALALVSAILVTRQGLLSTTNIAGDTLPVVLQLGGVSLVAREVSRRRTVAAAALCALGFLSKLNAVWGFAAILLCLALHHPRKVPVFVAAFVGFVGTALAILHLVTAGRMLDSIRLGLHASPSGQEPIAFSFGRVLSYVQAEPAVWLLFPIALVAVVSSIARKRSSVYEIGLLAALVVLLITLTDEGAVFNHLIDVDVLTVVAVGILAVAVRLGGSETHVLYGSILAALVLGLGASYYTNLGPATRKALRVGGYAARPLGSSVSKTDSILSEDPYVPVSLGLRPVVLDAFMLARIAQARPALVETLVRRIERREFDVVVLIERLDPTGSWYTRFDFGRAVATAIADNYHLAQTVGGYYVYRPGKG